MSGRLRGETRRGGILISVLVFTIISTFFIAGMATLVIGHLERARVESDFAAALDAADAGVNFEMRSISNSTANADQVSVAKPTGISYAFGRGSFTVYCTNPDGTTPWSGGNTLYVISKGTINGVSRTIKAFCTGQGIGGGSFGLFGIDSITKSGALTVTGDAGTNGTATFSGTTTVSGPFSFNGAGAGWIGSGESDIHPVYNAKAVNWQTVDQIAQAQFGATGLTYLATHNSNATATPPITGNQIVSSGAYTLTLKAGDYYLTQWIGSGSAAVTLDNRTGPVRIWFGPSGGSGGLTASGTCSFTELDTTTPANQCCIYVGTSGGFTFSGQTTIGCSFYAYNKSGGVDIGTFTKSGSTNLKVNGILLASKITTSGTSTMTFTSGQPMPVSPPAYYGFGGSWAEQGNIY